MRISNRSPRGWDEIGLEQQSYNHIDEAANGAFKDFTRAGSISALACRNIVPGLREGLAYSEACARVGYDHSARPPFGSTKSNSPVTRKALSEAIKQIRAVTREYGSVLTLFTSNLPGMSARARRNARKIRGIEKRTAEKERRRKEAAELLGRAPSEDELLRYELAKEQNFNCIYSGDPIDPTASPRTTPAIRSIISCRGAASAMISISTRPSARPRPIRTNADERRSNGSKRTRAKPEWMEYVARVEVKEVKGRKKRNYTLKDAASIEEKFKARNLTDTQWATRLLADELKRMFPAPEGERRVFTRPGAITSKLRRAWGLEGLKKENGERVPDDRHHAVDALVLAATTESLLKRLRMKPNNGRKKGGRTIFSIQPPWLGFRLDVERAVYGENGTGGMFVSRAERDGRAARRMTRRSSNPRDRRRESSMSARPSRS